MEQAKTITIVCDKREVTIKIKDILYVRMAGNIANFYVCDDKAYETRMRMEMIEKILGDDFIRTHRSYLVNPLAIHSIDKTIHLVNGDSVKYVEHRRHEVLTNVRNKRTELMKRLCEENGMKTVEDYHEHYKCFDTMPFAFADIEMVFDAENQAVDWIFKYGTQALAILEKLPLDMIIGSSFGELFANMDPKWLTSYERSAIYGEMLQFVEYSPEIDTNLNIICFPTFPGHCGCILFDISQVKSARNSSTFEKAIMEYIGNLLSV